MEFFKSLTVFVSLTSLIVKAVCQFMSDDRSDRSEVQVIWSIRIKEDTLTIIECVIDFIIDRNLEISKILMDNNLEMFHIVHHNEAIIQCFPTCLNFFCKTGTKLCFNLLSDFSC